MRKLASVRVINELNPIEGADNIELARVYGWNAIVQKGLYNVGDRVVFFEIDSILPIKPEYEFLRSRCYISRPIEGFRIKTMKLRGVLSQGLILPYNGDAETGEDVTEELGVKLHEQQTTQIPTHIKGHWPSYIAKTDQERVQNLTVPRTSYEITLKLDGTSETVYYYNGEVGVCSRNYKLQPEGSYWDAAAHILKALLAYKHNLAIQGELMGPKIQGNKLGLDHHEIYVFDIWDIDEQEYLLPDERREILDKLNDFVDGKIKHVPEIGEYTPAEVYDDEQHLREEILAMADITIDGRIQEGIVLKSLDMPYTFKAVNNRYLLKEK
jgi:RNA ligase (TIGR02306 family)